MSCRRVLPRALTGGEVLATAHVELDPVPAQVAAARRFVAEHAPALPDDTLDTLLLLTSELVTNAVLHARTAIELALTTTAEAVLVTVHDLDLARPGQRPYDGREGGWGLGLVAALAEDSGLELHDGDGKTAWFRLPRGAGHEVPDDAASRPQDAS